MPRIAAMLCLCWVLSSGQAAAQHPAIDELAIRKLLADDVEAYNSMDVQSVRRFRPSFKSYSAGLRSTVLTISNLAVQFSPDRQTAVVTLTVQYRNDFGKGVPRDEEQAVNHRWRLQRTPSGSWIIIE